MTAKLARLALIAGGMLAGGMGTATASSTYSSGTEDSAATTTTAGAVSKAAASQTAGLVGKRIGAIMAKSAGGTSRGGGMDGANGMVPTQEGANYDLEGGHLWGEAAGGMMDGVALWSNFTWTGMKEDTASTAFDGDIFSGIVGIDKRLGDKALAGIGFTFEGQGIDTEFNLGNQSAFGMGIAPYGAYQFNDMFGVNAMVGYTRLWGEQERRDGGVSSGTLISSDYDSHRVFANINGTATYALGDITLLGNAGFLLAEETTYGFLESDGTYVEKNTSHVGTLSLGGQAAYGLALTPDMTLEPFLSASYENDVLHEDVRVGAGQVEAPNDFDQFTLGYGVNLFTAGGITGSIEGAHVLGRENYEQTSVSATVRMNF